MVADIEELERMDAFEIHARRHNAKEVLTPIQSQMEPSKCVEEINQNEEWNKKFFEENRTGSLLQPHFKMTLHWMMRKLEMLSGLLQEISFVAITCNPESNCTCREKNHFLFR